MKLCQMANNGMIRAHFGPSWNHSDAEPSAAKFGVAPMVLCATQHSPKSGEE